VAAILPLSGLTDFQRIAIFGEPRMLPNTNLQRTRLPLRFAPGMLRDAAEGMYGSLAMER
jgi:hypothetical protein